MEALDDEQQRLAEEAYGRAEGIADRYKRIFPEHADEFKSSALWGAVTAASAYRAEEGDIWERWSDLWMKGAVKRVLRSPYVKKCQLWSQHALQGITEVHKGFSEVDASEALDRLLGLLPERHAKLCRLIYQDGMNPAQAGKAMGVSGKHGCKLHQEALTILRERAA